MRWGLGTVACVACYQSVIPPAGTPTEIAFADDHNSGALALDYVLDIPPATGLVLLVSVQLGTDCTIPAPGTQSVTFGGVSLSPVTSIEGGVCPLSASTRSELWQLVDPSLGDGDIFIKMAGAAQSLHSGAVVFAGVGPTPIVQFVAMHASGSATSASVTVATQLGDLVVSFVGQGSGIGSALGSATELYVQNAGEDTTLDNTAASVVPASASATTVGWDFLASDQWQMIAAAIR